MTIRASWSIPSIQTAGVGAVLASSIVALLPAATSQGLVRFTDGHPQAVASRGVPVQVFTDTLSQRYSSLELRAYSSARTLLTRIVQFGRSHLKRWVEPAVNLGRGGEIEVDWWCGTKNLSLTIGRELSYIRAWGANVDEEMEDGPLALADLENHWEWLTS